MIKIGSHVSMSGKEMFLGSVKQTLENKANAMMIYTGAPQNTIRKPVEDLMISEAHKLLGENEISLEDVVVHAPYIINLGNTVKPATFELGVEFLKKEILRVEAIGAKYIVLHPGAHVGAGAEAGIAKIIEGLNLVLEEKNNIVICLETMAGKGTECGRTFEEIAQIIDGVNLQDKIGVCLDTCHIHDAGYDLNNTSSVMDEFDKIIGLDRLKVLHINDSKNICGAKKDRHENIGYGEIGFDNIMDVINYPKLKNVVKILETPYILDKTKAPYKEEIEMIRSGSFKDWIKKIDK